MSRTNDRADETSEVAILMRVLTDDRGHFPPEVARYLLKLRFRDADKARITSWPCATRAARWSRRNGTS